MTWEAIKKAVHLFVHHGVVLDCVGKLLFLFWIWQFAIEEEVTTFEEIRLFG